MASPLTKKICEQCNTPWATRKPTARTCSPKCRALLRESEKPSPGRPARDYPAELLQQVSDLYESGATISEIGRVIGPGYKAQLLVERSVASRRKGGHRDQAGERNHMWRGDEAKYQALHLRVQVARGTPSRCACCDTTEPTTKYEWANLSGRYADINDYARLCIPCHRRLDAARRATTGKRLSPLRGGDGDV